MSEAASPPPSTRLRRPAQHTAVWIAGVLVCGILILLTYTFFVRTSSGQILEDAMFAAAEERRNSLSDRGFSLAWLLNISFAVPAVFFVIITLVRKRFIAAGIAALTFLGANITTQILKDWLLDRPHFDNGVPWLANSLPSGHTTLAAGAAVAVFLVSAPRQRPFMGFLVAFFATAVGAFTFIETWHRPSDIISAYLVVGLWALLGGWLIMRLEPEWNSVTVENDTRVGGSAGLAWFLGIILTGGALLAFLVAGGFNVSDVARIDDETSTWYWLAGILLAVGPGFLISAIGINFFDAEAGRRHRGEHLPKTSTLRYPVPPQFAHLYRV